MSSPYEAQLLEFSCGHYSPHFNNLLREHNDCEAAATAAATCGCRLPSLFAFIGFNESGSKEPVRRDNRDGEDSDLRAGLTAPASATSFRIRPSREEGNS